MKTGWHATPADALSRLPGPKGELHLRLFTHGSVKVVVYVPNRKDPQTPHRQDEVYVVIKGSGTFVIENARFPFSPGDLIFVPALAEHRFEDFTDDFATWAIFLDADGGA